MDYRVEIYDTAGRRVSVVRETPLLEVWRTGPDEPDVIRGLLPTELAQLGNRYEVRAYLAGRLAAKATIQETAPEWSDARKLILDDYVNFHEVLAFEARGEAIAGNTWVARAYGGQDIAEIVRDLIEIAPGAIHYRVAHGAYPEGAEREYAKFAARKTEGNALEVGGIGSGQWVGADRLDTSGAYAKDGDTIAGLVVDGVAWPDLRLMMIDSEELSLNSHAVSRHPETANWTAGKYLRSGYALKAASAKDGLQELIDLHGIDYVELNTHRNALGVFDDRVDAFGRYIGLVYGGGLCFNASMVEQGHVDVYLYAEGRFHDPAMRLKEYYSYTQPAEDSVAGAARAPEAFDFKGGVVEAIAALAYMAGGYTFRVDTDLAVTFARETGPKHVVFFEPLRMGTRLETRSDALANLLRVRANPVAGELITTHAEDASIDAYGLEARRLDYFAVSHEPEAAWLAEGLLADAAYPEPSWALTFYGGRTDIEPGDLVEVRGAPLRDYEPTLTSAWGGAFGGKRLARARSVRHRISGKRVDTTIYFTSALRSVAQPLSFIVRSQEPAAALFEFRLDDATVGLDFGYRLD